MQHLNKPFTLRLITFIAASAFLCYEMALQVALAVVTDPLMESAGMNASHLGWLGSCYFLSYTIMQIPAGLMFDRYSCRNVMFISAAICALGAIIFSYSPNNLFLIFLARFLIGAGSAFPFVGLLIVASNCFKPEQFPFFVGITQILAALGALIGSAPLAYLVQNNGWLEAMKIVGYAGIICTILMFFGLGILNKKDVIVETTVFKDIKAIIRNKKTWKIAAYAFFNWVPMIMLSSTWGPPFLVQKLNVSTAEAAKIIEFLWIGLSLGSFTLGSIAKTPVRQKRCMMICAIIGIAVSSNFIYGNLPNGYYYIICTLIGIASAGQILSFSMVKNINPENLVGTAIGFNNMSVVAGGIILQPIIGELMQIYWDGAVSNGLPFYSVSTFQHSLLIIPICYAFSFFSAIFLDDDAPRT